MRALNLPVTESWTAGVLRAIERTDEESALVNTKRARLAHGEVVEKLRESDVEAGSRILVAQFGQDAGRLAYLCTAVH